MTMHLLQARLHWEDANANIKHLEDCLSGLKDGVVVLPEMFSTGFSMGSKQLAEKMEGPTHQWMKRTARERGISICGSLIIEEHGHYYNRFAWVTPTGETTTYDKRHLFRMAGEHEHYSAGNENVTIIHQGITIRPQVCYDLRFPAWSRNGDQSEKYDLLLFVANWPAARREHWLTLLRARAIENLCYVVGVNRVGIDGNDVRYSGDTVAFGPQGETLIQLGDEESVTTFVPDLGALASYRESFPAHLDADQFEFRS